MSLSGCGLESSGACRKERSGKESCECFGRRASILRRSLFLLVDGMLICPAGMECSGAMCWSDSSDDVKLRNRRVGLLPLRGLLGVASVDTGDVVVVVVWLYPIRNCRSPELRCLTLGLLLRRRGLFCFGRGRRCLCFGLVVFRASSNEMVSWSRAGDSAGGAATSFLWNVGTGTDLR